MIKKTTATYEAAPTAIFSETFGFIFLANILSAAAKNVEVFPSLLRRIATSVLVRRDHVASAITHSAYHFCHCRVESKKGTICGVKYWEIIADDLSKAGWSWGCVSAINTHGRTIWIVDAHRDGKRLSCVRMKS
jgi:hypothetical protein